MENDFLQDLFTIGFKLSLLHQSKNPIKRLKAFLIYKIIIHKMRYIKHSVSPYYEWYHNAILFMNRIKYNSDSIISTEIISDESFQISKCSIDIEGIIYNVKITIPFDKSKNPSISLDIKFPFKNDRYTNRHYTLCDRDIIEYIDKCNDAFKSECVRKMVTVLDNELYNAAKYFLSGKWLNNGN